MFELFFLGGVPWMTFLTLNLLALLLAAWKAPAWVKVIGIIAFVFGVISFLIGFYVAGGEIAKAGEIPAHVVWAAFQIALITPIYGLIIYFVSLIIRIVQKPRI